VSAYARTGHAAQPRGGLLYLGWVGKGNLGDEALAQAVVGSLGVPTTAVSPLRAEWGARAARLASTGAHRHLMLGGGTTIGRLPWRRALRLHSLTTARAHPWLMLGAGVEDPRFAGRNSGSEQDELRRWLPLLRHFDAVTVRGPRSAQLLGDLGVEPLVVGDPALLLRPPPGDVGRAPGDPELVGVNVGFGDDLWGHNQGRVEQELAALVAWLVSTGRRVRLLEVNPEDRPAVQRVRSAALSRCGGPAHAAVELCAPATVADYLRLAGECTLVVGERLHSVVLAAAAGTPVISLEYQPKCRDFMESLHAGERCLRVDQLRPGELVHLVGGVLDDAPALAQADQDAVDALRSALATALDRLRAVVSGVPGATGDDPAGRARVTPRDRAWGDAQVAGVIGPVSAPSADELRAVLRAVAQAAPTHRVVSRIDPATGRWAPVPVPEREEWLDAHVTPTQVRLADGGLQPILQDLLRRRVPVGGFQLVAGTDFVGLTGSHVLGDVWLLNDLLTGLTLSTSGAPLPDRLLRHDDPWPLVRSLAALWRTNPASITSLFATAPAARPGRQLVQGHRSPTPTSPASCPSVAFARSSPTTLRELERWRRAHGNPSSMALYVSVAERALQASGLTPPTPWRTVLVDVRRYLPPSVRVTGNFVVGQRLTLGEWGDPLAVTRLLDRVVASGRPLVTLAGVSALHALGTVSPFRRRGDTGSREGMGSVTFNVIGALPGAHRLPRRPGGRERSGLSFGIGTTADGPQGLTVTMVHLDGALQVSIGFREPGMTAERVQQAAELLCADPVGLLDQPVVPSASRPLAASAVTTRRAPSVGVPGEAPRVRW